MTNKERRLDYYIADKLNESHIEFDIQGSRVKEISEALSTASKSCTGKIGYPEFVAISNEFVIVIEDKRDIDFHIKMDDKNNDKICSKIKNIKKYAVNGAVHYARHIIKNSTYKKVFAIGASGNDKHHKIQPVFVDENNTFILEPIDTFENFASNNIENYYHVEVLKELPQDEIELAEIIKIAKELHEDLRNYGQLSEQEKPLVISAILLALEDDSFNIESLKADKVKKDGVIIFDALETYLERVEVTPDTKKTAILNKFAFIKDRPKLNDFDSILDSSALAYLTKKISESISSIFKIGSTEDILGRFYGEFVKYSGGDGSGLGVVLTPSHITELFCELLEIKPKDIIFDPCCGTAGFLIAGMHYMLKKVKNKEEIVRIKQEQIHGIEIREDLFAIATTNMILRGDGKSNLRLVDFIKEDIKEIKKIGATVGLMNPPYSQAKTKDTAHLSEMHFIMKLLDSLKDDGNSRAAVIVPQSVMVGKNKEQKKLKSQLLEKHTLLSVITLNKETFYGVGTNPCIAIFKAHVPHDKDRRVKFFNFEDDGYEVKKHIGLVATERAKDRRKFLLDCYFDKTDAPSSFMVQSTIEDDDEWLHSFYYFNDEIPKEEDFIRTMADYLTFEFNMTIHGRGYLFEEMDEAGVIDE
ncbi:type I restriction-modification system DNA methylase subunit [Tissierella praeacuta]|uniref:HsdM family class I SAM-dependent methyltransferase n=1 Tax=Tissierella praeacuta TaxID=43131 RepID=UPI00104D23F5|nr:N-6 DNA methylase [Tissierella praeacuta]TCU74214.1 type I restriction-modification system DNA methylase subunit [Tissierella praeacuta]